MARPGLALALALALAVPGGLGPSPPAAAGELQVLARTGALSPDLLTRFERETGTRVHLVEVAESEEIPRRLEQPDEAGIDVAFPLDHQVAELIAHGRLERVWADRLPGFWNIEDPWRARAFDPRNEYTIPHQWGTAGLAVDTTVHKGNRDSLSLLFSPRPIWPDGSPCSTTR